MKTALNLFAALALFATTAPADNVALSWADQYAGPSPGVYPSANDVAQDSAGNVIVAGSFSTSAVSGAGGYVAKHTAAGGGVLWRNVYTGPAYRGYLAVAVDASGNALVTGGSAATLGGGSGIYTAKFSGTDGSLLWETTYSAPTNTFGGGEPISESMRPGTP